MIPKQDRSPIRQAREIEQKYNLNTDFDDIEKIAVNAQRTANNAHSKADEAVKTAQEAKENLSVVTEDVAGLTERVKTLEEAESVEGEAGATFTPSVDSDGNLSWTNDKGLENPTTVNIKGAKGDDGTPCTHSWNGTTLTVTSASGTSSANLKGDKGDKGDPGTGGSPGANATINGVNTLTIEAGDNIELEQSGSVLKIKSTASGGSAVDVLTVDEIRVICGFTADGLPIGYTLLQYIQSSGSQRIDTGYVPNNNTRVVMDFQLLSKPSSNAALFGARISSSAGSYLFMWHGETAAFRSDYIKTGSDYWYVSATDRWTVDKNKETTTLDGVPIIATNTEFDSTYNLTLFQSNNAGTPTWGASARVYSCLIYDNGTLIRDYVPVINPSGVYGLYDKANRKFYGNAGSGAFTGA